MALPIQPNMSHPLSALVVDDSQMTRKIHCHLLQSFGVQAREAENGLEAVQLLESGMKFDVILMDYEMAIMNGAEVTRSTRDMGGTSIILGVSAVLDNVAREEFINSGLDDLSDKPLTRSDLIWWVTI
ncbi:hypothetical protein C5167_016656 [Papaver somniferum]|uniref:two-component response regulator 24-like n=1 Tax=Papaver somniferum TaxID=3469 RepID=UPI000E6F4BD8|nr:two-component response regulator 24-like [Papaver somniferum]RZC93960.1 hypothetical protein C5167_016656 [Papaver somniferum]